jgi:arylsulfatase A-like enzyme
VLVFTSDHGEALGDHGLLTHGSSLFAAELHVPLIVMAPGRVPAGVRVERPVTNAALPATVMDLVGADASRFPRRSLRPLWETPAVSADWEHPMAEVERIPWAVVRAPARHGSMKAVITPHWHYIVHEKFEPQLYDRTTPSAIPVNVAARPELRAVVEALRAEVLRHLPGGPGPEAAR